MGGMVALQHACKPSPLQECLKGIGLLGVPCSGALVNNKFIQHMLAWAEHLTGPNPFAKSTACRSSLQLTGNDEEQLLTALSKRIGELRMPVASFSGGRNFLEFGSGRLHGLVRNLALQKLIGETPNDGLVGESSADITRHIHSATARHHNNYSDFAVINHTYLNQNQQVASILVSWLKTVVFP